MSEHQTNMKKDDDFWTPQQRAAIYYKGPTLQIIACAGSGKTLTVSRRIAQMVRDGVDRDSIVAFTFTDKAAEELKIRIREQMEKVNPENPIIKDMFIGTIHSFCLNLLKSYDPEAINYDVLDENKLAAFLLQHYRKIGLDNLRPRGPSRRFEKIAWFTEDINTIRKENVVENTRKHNDPVTKHFIEAYERFRELMAKYHFFDYEELIYRAEKLLRENPEILQEVRKRYRYFIVDEYQDNDSAQERLIELLTGDKPNLCVVGDDDQSIYKWRGAKPENFLSFRDRYKAKKIPLVKNHRSTKQLAEIAGAFIHRNKRRLEKKMVADVDFELGDIYQLYFNDEQEELDFILEKIRRLVGTVYKDGQGNEKFIGYGDIAILFRRKRDMDAIIKEFERAGIRFTVKGRETIFCKPETEFVRLAFAYVARGINPELKITGDEGSFTVGESDLRENIRKSGFIASKEDKIIDALNEMRKWYEKKPTERARRIYPQKEFQKILSSMGLGEKEAPDIVMYELGQVSKLLKDFEIVYRLIFPEQIIDLIEYLDWAYHHADSEIEDPSLLNAVNVMTIHRAKGIEFSIVFIPSLTNLKFSSHPIPRTYRRSREYVPRKVFDYREYEENEEDYRRLFYVAITRSRKYLFLTGAYRYRGYSRRQNPSLYFQEIRGLKNPAVIREQIDDPTPREKREVAGPTEGYIYPTSYTNLRYYQKCPRDYKLRHVYGFQPPINPAFGYGFAVRNILREIHKRYEGNKDWILPSPGEIGNMVSDSDRFYLRYAAGDVEKNLRSEATRILKKYVVDYREDVLLTYKADVPFEFLMKDDATNGVALVSGSIDLLQKVDPKTEKILEVNVIEFKTEHEPDSEFDPRLRDSKFQVRLYALATQSNFDLQTIDGYIHYLSEGTRKPVDLSDELLQQVRLSVIQNVSKIISINRQFFPTPSLENCQRCDWRKICPSRYKKSVVN